MTVRSTAGESSSGGSALGQVLAQLTGSSDSTGMGFWQPLVMAITVIAAAGFVIARRQTPRARD